MIGPTSETARSMMASLNAAMQKGMPPDQAIAYVKSQATQGVAPLADLYALMMQFQRLKQPKQEMPPGGNIKQQLDQLEAGLGGLGGQPQGMQNPMQSPMQNPMQQGLGGMNAGRMETPQFVGGGIVAFQQGGVPPANDPTAGMAYFKSMFDEQRKQYGAEDPSDFMKEDIERRRALRKEYDVGEGGEYQRAQEQAVATAEAEMPGREREARKLDTAEFFFNIAAEASKPGATLLSSIAGAGPGYVRQTRASKKELDALQKEARQARMELLKANELERKGDLAGAEALYTAGRQNMMQTGAKIAELTVGQQQAREERSFRAGESEKTRQFQRELAEFEVNAKLAAAEAEARVKAGTATSTDAAVARLYSRLSAATDALRKNPPESEEYKTAMQEAANVRAQLEEVIGFEQERRGSQQNYIGGPQGAGAGQPSGGSALPPGFVLD